MAAVRGGSKAKRLVWVYLTIVALLTFVGHRVGAELWDREWESAGQTGDPELGGLFAVGGIVTGFALAIAFVITHTAWRRGDDRNNY